MGTETSDIHEGQPTGDDDASNPVALYEQLHALLDQLDVVDTSGATEAEVAATAIEHERAVRRMISICNSRIMDVSNRAAYRAVGKHSLSDFMMGPLRLHDATKRRGQILALEETFTITGDTMPPTYPLLADALRSGALGADHLTAALTVLNKIPQGIDAEQLTRAEAEVAGFAQNLAPRQILAAGNRLLAYLDPDGTITDDNDRKRQRRLTIDNQDTQSMSRILGTLDPTTRAMLDTALAAWAAPGMNNPDDEASPTGSNEFADAGALKEAAARDTRTQSQRNHDALSAILRAVLDGGLLGASHRGLPPHLVVRISDTQLREYAGFGQTTTGADIPMPDLIRLAAQSVMHLAVFSEHTGAPLYFGTANRLANESQRFMLFAQYGGCSMPDCPRPFSHSEIHHAEQDWAKGGRTDIDELAPACGPHNRAVGDGPGQFTTEKIPDGPDSGRYGWRSNPDPAFPDRENTLRTNNIHDLDAIIDEKLERWRAELTPPVAVPESPTPPPADPRRIDDYTYPEDVADEIVRMLHDGSLITVGELEPV